MRFDFKLYAPLDFPHGNKNDLRLPAATSSGIVPSAQGTGAEWPLAIFAVVNHTKTLPDRGNVSGKLTHVHGYLFLPMLMRRLEHW
jgi:hypothetical protein